VGGVVCAGMAGRATAASRRAVAVLSIVVSIPW
jgi:hypothetical protein